MPADGENDSASPAEDSLPAAAARHGIALPQETLDRLDAYCRLLWDWNEKLNLTRHTTYEKFVSRDLVDTLAFAHQLREGETVIDVGTGGGVPGIPLAIVRGDLHVTLTESVRKKARAVEQIVRSLGLDVPVYHGRAEELLEKQRADTLVARAVAPLAKLVRWLQPHWSRFDRLLVIKGPAWTKERAEARQAGLMRSIDLRKLASYPLLETGSQSVLLELRRKSNARR